LAELAARIAEFREILANDQRMNALLCRMPKTHFLLAHFNQFAEQFYFLGLLTEQGFVLI
jgi:hypothetical protein